MSGYRGLDGARILETITQLERRIAERFPEARLRHVAGQLAESCRTAIATAPTLARPNLPLRAAVILLAVLLVAGVITVIAAVRVNTRIETVTDLVQTLESGVNDVVFVGVAIWFLSSLEGRTKRRRALTALHELRSLAHIVDMHQLTKDPEYVLRPAPATASSPQRGMSRFELARYLDYCSELLALTGKVAALYAQHLQDHVVLGTVDEVESLTTDIARKIWQKIGMLDRAGEQNS